MLLLRQDEGSFGEILPIKALPTAVTVSLVFPFHGDLTPRADRVSGHAIRAAETSDMRYGHGSTKSHLLPNGGRDQQFVRR